MFEFFTLRERRALVLIVFCWLSPFVVFIFCGLSGVFLLLARWLEKVYFLSWMEELTGLLVLAEGVKPTLLLTLTFQLFLQSCLCIVLSVFVFSFNGIVFLHSLLRLILNFLPTLAFLFRLPLFLCCFLLFRLRLQPFFYAFGFGLFYFDRFGFSRLCFWF